MGVKKCIEKQSVSVIEILQEKTACCEILCNEFTPSDLRFYNRNFSDFFQIKTVVNIGLTPSDLRFYFA